MLKTCSTEETFLPRFLSNSEASASELLKILEQKCVTWSGMLSASSNLQPHTDVLPVMKKCSI